MIPNTLEKSSSLRMKATFHKGDLTAYRASRVTVTMS